MMKNTVDYVEHAGSDVAFLDKLRKASIDKREEILVHYLKHEFGKMLHLKAEEIPIDTHLMYLGLDSLIFLRLIEVVASDLEIQIEPQEAFEAFQHFTVQNLAKRLAKNIISEKRADVIDIVEALGGTIVPHPEHRHLPFDLTDIQRAYWIGQLGVLAWGNVPCHTYAEFEREDDGLDFNRFNYALQRLIERHDMLRAVVQVTGKQQILKQVPSYKIDILDLREADPEVVESHLDTIRQQMIQKEPQSAQWPLFEFRATRFNGNRVRFHIDMDLLIFDGQSIQIMFRDLAWYYNNPDGSLDPFELSFRDYVDSLTVVKDTDLYKKSQAYWADRLSTLSMPPELPMVKDPASLSKFNFVSRIFNLDSKTWNRLKSRAAKSGITPTCLLLTAYTIVLTTWNKSPQLTLNLTQYNRLPLHSEVTEIMGDFTSVLLVSVDNSGHDDFETRARRIQKELWAGMEHRYFNGIEVMREMTKIQDGTPYIVPYVFTSVTGVGANIGEEVQEELEEALMGKYVFMATRTPQVILDHMVYERGGGLFCRWDVVEELFPDDLIGDMFEAFCTYLKRLADEDVAWQKTTPTLIPEYQIEERVKINTTETLESPELLHTLFTNNVLRQPKHPAIISSNRSLNYEELSGRAHQVGHLLRKKGAELNMLVAIVMEKGWEQVVAALGVLNSGAAYLPIDIDSPEERLLHLLENGEVNLVLTQSWLENKFEYPERIDCVSVDKIEAGDEESNPLEPIQKPEDLAYVIYTSGSTGLPKGVMIDHRGAVNTILDVNKRFDVGPEDRMLALSNLNFDLSVYDIFGTLAAGGTIVIPDHDKIKDPDHWLDLINCQDVTIWNTVPMFIQMLVEYFSGSNNDIKRSLRLILLSGDWIPLDLPDKIKNLMKNAQIISLGGATEASIWSILYPIETVPPELKSIPYGRPLSNQKCYVLNERMKEVPDRVTGMIYIGGIGLARGYWNDKKKTDGAFVLHPETKELIYRTGDLGRYLPDGNIEFLGREDFQVKINGYRVELIEIEEALKKHKDVKDAIVTVQDAEVQKTKRVLGYVITGQACELDIDDIKVFLSACLPDYMIPQVFIFLDSFPLTQSGKVDRKKLSALEIDCEDENTFIPPETPTQKILSDIWCRILDVEQLSLRDEFFMLGGNSLLATQVIFEIHMKLTQKISLPQFFKHTTIEKLSKIIDDLIRDDALLVSDIISVDELNKEAVTIMESSSIPEMIAEDNNGESANIFLTGATGFLGCFLLYELLCQTNANIYCLVRSSGKIQAKKKIHDCLKSFSLWDEEKSARVVPVAGDLCLHQFGLTDKQFAELADLMDSIYHNAAWTHFAYSYDTLKPTNVLGTIEVLKLASLAKTKSVHYISTTAVFSNGIAGGVIGENTPIEYDGFLSMGYPQSKWVSEKLMRMAKTRGLPVSIYRPGMITGHSKTGISNLNDAACRMIKGCIQVGYAPQIHFPVDVLPVDFVSESIVNLSLQKSLKGKTFNVVNPHTTNTIDLLEWVSDFGYPLEQVPYKIWREKLINGTGGGESNALFPLLPVFPEDLSEKSGAGPITFDVQNVLDGIKNSDITVPTISKELLYTYFENFIDVGFIEKRA